ncbi:hypothetical protein [[Erwinia] mediterraneensis]|uniref:hypothetical protein n=1 Tax=[Erwinia] mediterraneensis TaxID=2161819 RepID=UPI00102F9A47|nr:hypothetical protein [[Erwinia] mediterraneensis]
MPKIRTSFSAQDWRLHTGLNNKKQAEEFQKRVKWLAEHPGLNSDNFQRWLLFRFMINVIAVTNTPYSVPSRRQLPRDPGLSDPAGLSLQNRSALSVTPSASLIRQIQPQKVNARSKKHPCYPEGAQRKEDFSKAGANPAIRSEAPDVALPLIVASVATTLPRGLHGKTFPIVASVMAITGSTWLGRQIYNAFYPASVNAGIEGIPPEEKVDQRAIALVDRSSNNSDTRKMAFLNFPHGFNGLWLNEEFTDYARIRTLSTEDLSKNGTFAKRYLKTEQEFRNLIQDDILQEVDNKSINVAFHGYIRKFIDAVVAHDYVQVNAGDKSLRLVTTGLAIIYNTLLMDIAGFDSTAYYDIYSEEEILLFTRLRYTLKNVISYIQQQQTAPYAAIFSKPLYQYYIPGMSLHDKYDFINAMVSPFIANDTTIYRAIMQQLKKQGDSDEISDIIYSIYEIVLNGISKLLSLPVSISHQNSSLNLYINHCTWILERLQGYFGNLYIYDGEDHIDTSVTSSVKKLMTNSYGLFEEYGENNVYKDIVDRIFNGVDFASQPATGISLKASENAQDNAARKIVNKYNALIAELLPGDSGQPERGSKTQDDSLRYLLTSLQEMIAINKQSYQSLPADKRLILDRFGQAAIGYTQLSQSDIRHVITDTLAYHVLPTMLADKRQRQHFPVSLLSRLTGFDIKKIQRVSEKSLLNSGEFNRVKQQSLEMYNDETLRWIEYGIYLFTNQEVSDTSKRLIDILSLPGIDDYLSDSLHHIQDKDTTEEELIMFSDLSLALRFLNEEIHRDDTLISFGEKVMLAAIGDYEKFRKQLEDKVFTQSADAAQSASAINALRRVNLILLSLRNEYSERLDTVKYIKDIIAHCSRKKGRYISPFLPKNRKGIVSTINLAKVAAVRHFYNRTEPDRKNDDVYLNMYNALVYDDQPEACHLRILSSLYWNVFYHPLFHSAANPLLQYLDVKSNVAFGEFASGKDDLRLRRIRALLAYASSAKLVRLFDLYSIRYQEKVALIENALGYKKLERNYFSITDIKRRSSIAGHSAEKFAQQFKNYNADNDIAMIISQFIDTSAIEAEKLLLKPKAIFAYKHLNKKSDQSAPAGRDDDLLILFTEDNHILLSWASGFYNNILWLDAKKDIPSFADINLIIKDLAPCALSYRPKVKDNAKIMARLRGSVLSLLSFRYGLQSFKEYNVTSTPYPEHLAINVLQLGKEKRPEFGVVSDEQIDIALFQRSSVTQKGSINDILKEQLKNYFTETVESLKVIYNDDEDITDQIINFIPFARAIRQAWNKLPLSSDDIVFLVMDLLDGLGIILDAASGVVKNSLRKLIREEVIKEFIPGKKMTFEQFSRVTHRSLKKVIKSAGFLSRSAIKSLANATPLPLITQSYRLFSGKKTLLASGGYSDYAEMAKNYKKSSEMTNRIILQRLQEKMGENNFKAIMEETEKPFLPALSMDTVDSSGLYHEIENYLEAGKHLELYHRFQNRIQHSVARFVPGKASREQVIAHALSRGYRLYFHEGDDLHRLTEAERYTASKARNGVNIAFIKVQNAKAVLDHCLSLPRESALYKSLKKDIKDIVGNVSDAVIADVLHTLSTRNTLVLSLLKQWRENHFRDLIFFRTATNSPSPLAFVYPGDASHAVFYNLESPLITPYRVLKHEASHQAGTKDFIYQNYYPGTLRSTKSMINSLHQPGNIQQFMARVPPRQINMLFGLPRDAPVGIAHYETAYGIVHSPDFPVQMLNSNADSYVDLVELINRKYAAVADESGQVSVTINAFGKREAAAEEDTLLMKQMLGIAWLTAGSIIANAAA